jgi:hypothetical protein
VEVKADAWPARVLPEADSLAVRARFHVAMGRGAEARALAGQALGLDPGSAAAHEALALLAWREGKRSEAREALATATSLSGATDYAHYLYGNLLWESLEGAAGLELRPARWRRAEPHSPAQQSLAQVEAPPRAAEPPPRVVPVPGRPRPETSLREHRLAPVERRAPSPAPAVTVAFDLVVEDARGQPVTDLRLEEIEVVQDATRQKVRAFEAGSRPGRYELTYAPLSGKAGAVTVRVTRRGAVVRGPDGPSLKPRVISALSARRS